MDEDEATDSVTAIELPEVCEFMHPSGKLDPPVLDWIGRELRGYYEEVLREPVPQRLLALVDQRLARRTFH